VSARGPARPMPAAARSAAANSAPGGSLASRAPARGALGGSDGLARLALLLAWLSPLASFLIGLGGAPLTDVDEGAFAQATRELMASDDWTSTTLLGQPRWDKPILIYWLQALSVQAFGTTVFAFRLPSALAGVAWAWLVGAFVVRVSDQRRGALAVLTLACTLGPHVIGRVSTADALLNALMAAAALHAYMFMEDRDRRALRIAAVCVALGLLVKGPIALLVPGAAVLLHVAIQRKWVALRQLLADPWSWVILIGIAAPWYGWQLVQHGQAFIDGFILKHNVGRFTSTMHGFAAGPLYYPIWTVIALLPALWMVVPMLIQLVRGPRPPAFTFGLAWFAFVLVFFTISATKLPHYGFYGLTGLVVAMVLARPERIPRAAFVLPVGLLIFCAAWPKLLGMAASRVKDPFYAAAIPEAISRFDDLWSLLCVAGATALAMLAWSGASRRRPIAAGEVVWALASIVSILVLGPGLINRTIDAIQRPVVQAAEIAARGQMNVVMWGIDVPSFAVLAGTRVERRDPQPGEIVLTKTQRRADLAKFAAVDKVFFERADVSLLKLAAEPEVPAAPAAPAVSSAPAAPSGATTPAAPAGPPGVTTPAAPGAPPGATPPAAPDPRAQPTRP